MSHSTTITPESATAGSGVGRGVSRFLYTHERFRLSLLLASPVAWLVILYLGSLASMIIAAFWQLAPFTGDLVRTFSLSNFQTLLTAEVYRTVALRSLGIAIAVTVIDLLFALPIAFFAAKVVRSHRIRYAIVIASTMPLWAGYLVKGYAWRIMLDNNGVLDWLLQPLGIKGPGLGLPATILALAYLWLPYMILPIYAGLDEVELDHLARADVGHALESQGRQSVPDRLALGVQDPRLQHHGDGRFHGFVLGCRSAATASSRVRASRASPPRAGCRAGARPPGTLPRHCPGHGGTGPCLASPASWRPTGGNCPG